MKAPHLLLAFYIFFSALYPCRDSDLNVDEIKGAVEIVADHDHSHSGTETDICTPFCICACCSAHISLVSIDAIEAGDLQHNTIIISHYIARAVPEAASAIWQPPRI